MADPDPVTPPTPIGFAHHGAGQREAPSSWAAFALAERLGATGLASTVWVTVDGKAVVDQTGVVGGRFRRRAIGEVAVAVLPESVVRLDDLFAGIGPGVQLSLDIGDPSAVAETVAVARDAQAEDRLWLCHGDAELLASWRPVSEAVRFVQVTRLRAMKSGPERRAADLRAVGVDGVRLPQSDWNGGLVSLFHRFDLFALAADAQFARTVAAAVGAGVDGVYSDDPEVLAAINR